MSLSLRCFRMLLGAAFALLIARVGNAALLASEHSPATTISQKDAAADQAADAEKRSDAEDVDKYQVSLPFVKIIYLYFDCGIFDKQSFSGYIGWYNGNTIGYIISL